MNISLISDVHLDVLAYTNDIIPDLSEELIKNETDILVIAGDLIELGGGKIEEDKNLEVFKEFFHNVKKSNTSMVLWVFGNHEYYGGYLNGPWARDKAERMIVESGLADFVRILDDEILDLEGVRIIGATLWTGFNRGNPLTMLACRNAMNDYRRICYDPDFDSDLARSLQPEDVLEQHELSLKFIQETVEESETPVIVITHHAPIMMSYEGAVSYAYYNELGEFIKENTDKIKCWFYGHTHRKSLIDLDDTIIASNPRGYGSSYEPILLGDFKLTTFKIVL
jgi:Icc-related predicted phosphoesterase